YSLPRPHPDGQAWRRDIRVRPAPGLPAHGSGGTLCQGRADGAPARLRQVSRQPGAGKTLPSALALSAERKVRERSCWLLAFSHWLLALSSWSLVSVLAAMFATKADSGDSARSRR